MLPATVAERMVEAEDLHSASGEKADAEVAVPNGSEVPGSQLTQDARENIPEEVELEDEAGAFDDSELQVDQPKKKKRGKRKPKSKRGLVTGLIPGWRYRVDVA
jgi:hypothetical protein